MRHGCTVRDTQAQKQVEVRRDTEYSAEAVTASLATSTQNWSAAAKGGSSTGREATGAVVNTTTSTGKGTASVGG